MEASPPGPLSTSWRGGTYPSDLAEFGNADLWALPLHEVERDRGWGFEGQDTPAGTLPYDPAAMSAPPRKLSVGIPCLNAASTLGVQLAALTRQSWPGGWEVIVADNGSTDGSREIVESYRGRLPGLELVDASDRRGQAHARNAGAAAASGDAFLFGDADDEVAPGWLAALGRALAVHEFVACRYDNQK